jgi:hypothetical protein
MLAAAIPAVSAFAQGSDPIYGTWKLNVAKSTYSAGNVPKSQTRVYAAAGKGYKFTATGVDAAGKATKTEFTVAYDGKNVPVTGSAAYDSINVKRVDANTLEAVQSKGGKVVGRTHRVLSKDGKTLTTTGTGTNAQGKAYTNVEVFEKQP